MISGTHLLFKQLTGYKTYALLTVCKNSMLIDASQTPNIYSL